MTLHEAIIKLQELEVKHGGEVNIHVCNSTGKLLLGTPVDKITAVQDPKGKVVSVTLFTK